MADVLDEFDPSPDPDAEDKTGRVTVRVPPSLTARARSLNVVMAAAARDGIEHACDVAERAQAASDDYRLVRTRRAGVPVAFKGRLIANHDTWLKQAYITPKGFLVIVEGIAAGTAIAEDLRVYEQPEDFFTHDAYVPAGGHSDDPSTDAALRDVDEQFATAVADAFGITHHQLLDL